MNDVCLSRPGYSWKKTADTWFDSVNNVNNNLNKMFDIK